MPEEILINVTPQETRVAVLHQGVVQELHIERSSSRGIVGNIYLGKVVRILPGMQSAFIDVGLERTAFLHVGDILAAKVPGEPLRPIERMLVDGQSILVQAIKDPIGTKGARLSTQMSLAGRMLVYLPQEKHIGVSQRIEKETEREALRERLTRLVPEDEPGGFIVRTSAEGADDETLSADINYLRKLWRDIKDTGARQSPPSVVYQELSLGLRVLRDFVNGETARIVVDSRENHQKVVAFAEEYTPNVLPLIEHYTGQRPLFDLHGVEDEIEKALARRVELKSGGYLIVDQTEALTTVDVNTGGYVGARNFDDTIFKTNLEAAQAIARQLRLRNLGGIIIVDFIDMVREDHREAVLAEFRKQLARDRVKTMAGGFSQLGLLEMTRKRTRESLAHMLCEPCAACQGKGSVKTARSVAYDILREILREARQFNPREFRVVASPKVIELFLDEESQHLAGLIEFVGKSVSLQSEAAMGQEQYDIILM